MYTYTPRDDEGKFNSWKDRVDTASQYDGKDVAIGLLIVAAGVALWEGCKFLYKEITE